MTYIHPQIEPFFNYVQLKPYIFHYNLNVENLFSELNIVPKNIKNDIYHNNVKVNTLTNQFDLHEK
jgi:hypothetical protein